MSSRAGRTSENPLHAKFADRPFHAQGWIGQEEGRAAVPWRGEKWHARPRDGIVIQVSNPRIPRTGGLLVDRCWPAPPPIGAAGAPLAGPGPGKRSAPWGTLPETPVFPSPLREPENAARARDATTRARR